MKLTRFVLLLCFCSLSLIGSAQIYVGELLIRGSYEYIKLECSSNVCTFAMPYVDGESTYKVIGDPFSEGDWTVQRELETWSFNTTPSEEKIVGTLTTKNSRQKVVLYEQLTPLSESALQYYEGSYGDDHGNRAIVYTRNGYLHIMSPYSERTMSLKPIGDHLFWTVSGARWQFSSENSEKPSNVTYQDRFSNTRSLQRLPAVTIEEIWIPIATDTLYGKLFMPTSTEKVPACLVLPGGGAVGMDNYEYEARFFAAHGIASLIFDKSGNGKSKGPGNFRLQTFDEKNEQYQQLFAHLQQHPKIDPARVGVHGPSEGGRLALMMAADLQDIAFVNATAAPIMTMKEGQLYAVDHYLRNIGMGEQDIIDIRNIWRSYYDEIIAGAIDPKTIEAANRFREQNDRLFLPPNYVEIPGAPRKEDLVNNEVVDKASEINCPVLLQYGENDQRVHAWQSIRNFRAAINEDTDLDIIIYPRASHSFMTPEFEISHGYLDDKLKWLRQIGIVPLNKS
jgi:dienelactone hydrolase